MELQSPAIVLSSSVLTGIIHLFIGSKVYIDSGGLLNLMLVFDGLGFLSFSIIFYIAFVSSSNVLNMVSSNREMFLFASMVFTFISFISYFIVWGIDGLYDATGMITKLIEIILLLSLNQNLREGNA